MRIKPIILAVLLALSASVALAADLEKGLAAANSGDYQTAFENFLPLAAEGHVSAQLALADMYDKGNGVPKDIDEALRWYRMAAEQGNAQAQSYLGDMATIGVGVPLGVDVYARAMAEAVRWYRKAAAQGYAAAQFKLGEMSTIGMGVQKDEKEAMRWYRMAAEQDYAEAQFTIGMKYAIGRGVPQDYITAHMWYNIASTNDRYYSRARELIALKMPLGAIIEAQRRARICMSSGYQNCD